MTMSPSPNPVNRFQQALLSHFADRPDSIFCRQVTATGETAITWRELAASCGAFAAAYRQLDTPPQSQVLIFLRHVPQLYGAFFGAMLAGLTPAFMPCSSPRQDPEIYWRSHDQLLRLIRPAAVVTDAATLSEMKAAGLSLDMSSVLLIGDVQPATLVTRPEPENAIALLQHSSGTTGLKKGVSLSYGAIVDQIESYGSSLSINDRDVIVSWLPLYHDMGLIACLMLPAYYAIPVIHLDPFHWVSRPDTLFDHIVSRNGTLTWLPNFAFDHLSATMGRRAAQWNLAGMRAFINCSEPCKAATFDRFAATFASSGVRHGQLQCCYAMAETVFAVSQSDLGDAGPMRIHVAPSSLDRGCIPTLTENCEGVELIETGRVIDGLELSIHDQSGGQIPSECVGEIGIRGRFLFSGYNRDAERTAERIRDGVYFTRDLGFMYDNHLYVLGRLDDLIIINGRNLYAHEVEAAVHSVEGLKPGRTVAIAWFDSRIGSETLVIMAERAVTNERPDKDIRHDISQVVHSIFNVMPRAIELLDEGRLVKTSSGKISRKENLERFIAARSAQP